MSRLGEASGWHHRPCDRYDRADDQLVTDDALDSLSPPEARRMRIADRARARHAAMLVTIGRARGDAGGPARRAQNVLRSLRLVVLLTYTIVAKNDGGNR